MARTNEFLQFKRYSNFEKQLNDIRKIEMKKEQKIEATNAVYSKMYRVGAQIKQRYMLTDHGFAVWLQANKEFLKSLPKFAQQKLHTLEKAYYTSLENDENVGTEELQALFKYLEEADYTHFVSTYEQDFSQAY